MKQILIIVFAILMPVTTALAQIVEIVETSDGSVYEGYISEQIPGKQLSVYAERATLVFPIDSISDIRDNIRRLSSFGDLGKSWLREHVDTGKVILSSFQCDNVFWDDVRKLGQDGQSMKVVYLRPKTFVIDWENVTTIRKSIIDVPYGLYDVVTLLSGEQLIGQIVEQVMGKHIVIRDREEIEHIVDVQNILSVRSEQMDMTVPISQQIRLLDRLVFEGDSTVCGHIESKVIKLGKNIKFLSLPDSTEQSFQMADVRKYQKYPNPDFVPYVEPAADTTKIIRVNGGVVELSKTFCSGPLTYVTDSCISSHLKNLKVGSKVKVEMKNISCDSTVALFKLSEEKLKSDVAGDRRVGSRYPAYNSSSWPVYECTVGLSKDVQTIEFIMKESGKYFLRLDNEGNGFIVEAKN